MNILIFGATGPTGRLLVQQGLEQGHNVTAFARNPSAVTTKHERFTVVQGDVLDAESVEEAVKSTDAVLSALGVRKLCKTTVLSEGIKNIIAAMKWHGVKRLIVESSLGVGDSKGQLGWFFSLIVVVLLRNIYADKEVQERYIRDSGLDWIIVRPAALTNGPRTGTYQHWVGKPRQPIKVRISRADVAEFMLKQLTSDLFKQQAPGLSY